MRTYCTVSSSQNLIDYIINSSCPYNNFSPNSFQSSLDVLIYPLYFFLDILSKGTKTVQKDTKPYTDPTE